MSRPHRIDPNLVVSARVALAQATDVNQLRAAQAILWPSLAHTTLEQTAALLGVGRATVPRLQQRFREGIRPGRPCRGHWGGRRRAELAETLGRKVAPSVVYRLLARQGWRKVAPDTRHPKSDPLAQAEWKKNSPRRWQPC